MSGNCFSGLLLVTRRSARLAWHAGHADREASCIGFGMPGMPIGKPVALGLACRACRSGSQLHWVWHARHADREASCIGFGMPGMPIGKPVALGLACPVCRSGSQLHWVWHAGHAGHEIGLK